MRKHWLLLPFLFGVISCMGSSDNSSEEPAPEPVPEKVEVALAFVSESDGWQVGFADYPPGEEDFYQLNSEYQTLPEPLENYQGLLVEGNNHSDDLFMFVKKQITGLVPDTRYQLSFEVTLASNAESGCFGIGGAPGESVAVKAGAAVTEPEAVDNGAGRYLMNIDKGNQMQEGSDGINLGDIANSRPCEGNPAYELKTLTSGDKPFSVMADAEGKVWLFFGTDSGFEGMTSLYYVGGKLTATPQ